MKLYKATTGREGVAVVIFEKELKLNEAQLVAVEDNVAKSGPSTPRVTMLNVHPRVSQEVGLNTPIHEIFSQIDSTCNLVSSNREKYVRTESLG